MDEQAEILQLTKDKLTLQSQLDAAQDIFKAEQQAAAGWKACADDYRQKLLKAQMEIAELKQKLTLAQQGECTWLESDRSASAARHGLE